MNRQILFSTGGSVVLLSVGMFSSGWPSFITTHSWTVWLALFIGLVIILAGFLLPAIPANETPDSTLASTAGRDSNVAQLNAQGGMNIYGDSALNALISKPVVEPLATTPTSVASEVKFEVTWHWMDIVYEMVPGLWKESGQFDYDKDPRRAFVVSFVRPIPIKGQRAVPPVSLVAILKFKHAAGEENVPRAYWLGLTHSEVVFSVGHPQTVIAGRLEYPHFASYVNQYQHDGMNEFFDVPLRQLGERKVMPATHSVIVEISLFDMSTSTTVEQRKYVLMFGQAGAVPSVTEEEI